MSDRRAGLPLVQLESEIEDKVLATADVMNGFQLGLEITNSRFKYQSIYGDDILIASK